MTRHRYTLVLSVCVTTRGLAFVLFEGEANPVDWGRFAYRGSQKNHRCIERFVTLIEKHRPDIVVLEDPNRLSERRSDRAKRLALAFAAHTEGHGIPFAQYARADVLAAFGHLSPCTKQSIAESIVKLIPVFEQHLPSVRKPWMGEDARMGIFEATALGLTHFEKSISVTCSPDCPPL